ncbi:MAG: DUF6916 family protein [Thermoleophilaceae bacterium]
MGTQTVVSSHTTQHTLTRRGLLASGGVAGAAAFAALNPHVASAITAIGDDPAYLRRSGYARLPAQDFAAGSWGRTVTLTLAEVGDLPGREGRDDAFALLFAGPPGIEGGIQPLSHPSLGSFRLMISPVDPTGRSQDYEAIVDRSRGLTRRLAPRAPRGRPEQRPPQHRPPELVSHAQVRQGRHGVRAELVLGERLHPRRAHASLVRDGKPVAISGARAVHDHRVVLQLSHERLRRGRYDLVVVAGEHAERVPVTLR